MSIELGPVSDWIAAIGSIATAVVAWIAFLAWRTQLRGASKHAAAAEIAESAQLLRYHFYDARSSLIFAGEFPESYHAARDHTDVDKANAYAYVYERRFKAFSPRILRAWELRAKAGALLSDDVADALGLLARIADRLRSFFEQAVDMVRDGKDLVAQYPDQDWVKLVRSSVRVDPQERTDPYSQEFEAAFEKLKTSLTPYL